MLHDLCPGCSVEVDRGPDWLFLRIRKSDLKSQTLDFADEIWRMLDQGFTRRLVVEMQDVAVLPSELVGALVRLQKRISEQGGLMRLAGLSERNQAVLQRCQLADRFPQFADRAAAVMGSRPSQPR